MDTVTLVLSIYDALAVVRNNSLPTVIRDAAEQAILSAFKSVNTDKADSRRLNLCLKSVPCGYRVRAISVIKHTIGYGLREAKDFVDTVIGKQEYYDNHHRWVPGVPGTSAVLTDLRDKVNSAAEQLRGMGCEVIVDDWGCKDPD